MRGDDSVNFAHHREENRCADVRLSLRSGSTEQKEMIIIVDIDHMPVVHPVPIQRAAAGPFNLNGAHRLLLFTS